MSCETDRHQLVKAYVQMEMPDGKVKRVLAGLDTQANVSFVNKRSSRPRSWRTGEEHQVAGFNGQSVNTKPRVFTIVKNGKKMHFDAREEPKGGHFQVRARF